ncbi:HNH endonuclease [Bacillaceae bacterium Marseille-Q3522]|nr:HNH endonuclease [Bacillaceae bacterium Marseille-Q3522]
MSEIQIKVDELEAFADEIKKAEWHCDDALDALNWHLSSLLADFPGVLPDAIQDLEAEFRHSIELYQGKLDEAQALIKLTVAEMREADQELSDKIGEFLLDVVGWYDIQRIYSEYDPVTGEKLGAGDRLLALGMVATSVFPPGKLASVGGKSVAKGVKAGIETASKTGFPSLAENAGAFKKMKNVINPKKVKEAFDFVYTQVIKAPISATKYWFDQVIKKLGDVPIPAFFQTQLVGIGAVQKTVRESFEEAKETIVRMIRKGDGDVGDIKGTVNGTPLKLEDFTKEILETKPMNSPIPKKWYDKGGKISIDSDGTWTYTNKSGVSVRYPDGYPDFTPFMHPNVKPVKIKVHSPKNNPKDFENANIEAKLSKDTDPPIFDIRRPPIGYTWHHHQDGETMLLVVKDIHDEFKHIGGQSTVNGKNN